MNYIKLMPHQVIELAAKKDATPAKAINETIEFCKEHEAQCCKLYLAGGFCTHVDTDSDLKELVKDYYYWLECQQDDEDPDSDDTRECCDECECFHGHFPWCDHSNQLIG